MDTAAPSTPANFAAKASKSWIFNPVPYRRKKARSRRVNLHPLCIRLAMLAHEKMNNSQRLEGADGIRGLACLTVLLTHAVSMFFIAAAGRHLAGTGKIGVWLFFVLSALLLTRNFQNTGFGAERLISYGVGRVLRILPLFIIAVLVHKAFGALGIVAWSDVMAALTFQKGYAHLWTVPVEFTFYLWLPLVAAAFIAARAHSIGAAAILLVGLVFAQQLVWPYWETPMNALGTGWYASSFTIGCFLAVTLNDFRSIITDKLANILAGSVALGLVLAAPGSRHALFDVPLDLAIVDKFVYISAAWAIFIVATIDGKGIFGRLVTSRIMRKLGAWSYSLYLFHGLVLVEIADRFPNNIFAMLVGIAAAIAVGAASFYAIEFPIERYRQRLQRAISARVTGASAV